MTKSEFYDWKSSFVTQEVMKNIQDKVKEVEYVISRTTGDDTKVDLIRRGYILAMEDILKMEYEGEDEAE